MMSRFIYRAGWSGPRWRGSWHGRWLGMQQAIPPAYSRWYGGQLADRLAGPA